MRYQQRERPASRCDGADGEASDCDLFTGGCSEDFQDQETWLPGERCLRAELLHYSHSECGEPFHRQISAVSSEQWCVLEQVIR